MNLIDLLVVIYLLLLAFLREEKVWKGLYVLQKQK